MRTSIILGSDHQWSKMIALSQGTLKNVPYTPYGCNRSQGSAAIIGFTGQYFDGYLEGYLLGNGYRVYSPWLMRFNSPDRVSPFGRGGINAYAYCEGDPVNWQDHSGSQKGRSASMINLSKSFDSLDVFVSALRKVHSYAKSFRDSLNRHQLNVKARVGDAEYFLDIARRDGKPYQAEHLELLRQLPQLVLGQEKVERKKSRVEGGIKKLTGFIGRIEGERFEEPLQSSGMIPIESRSEHGDVNYLMADERRRLGTWPSSEMAKLRQ
ncbi:MULTISPECIES: RHS repeat-associated core domain-containing protein [unclassified Pseudomonas]|uniref:RHS repeat-associated core domain-containing protein n=1 Tax=unclassified Pseudomonas TaxID=196821 RepID=UPI000C8862B1|nr:MULTISPECIES: RHS repeat-associated core domain-containing protein [unclassified Pseudomonas]PNA02327.1 hypothetical protein C1X79_02025 [Pseudomonas sp. FW305-42]PNA26588.1 hypothetical protein C1X78_05820 [Pseudomonas sp. MPR-R1B]PNB29147.1 hypothetical protein C1X80_01955 [Pseudomonas sp. DP16D-E2]PNB44437.1 hypothetical protein C1X75_06710 [Pseudomonas sp. FW305-17]PNB63768.1 hypothetical protein C1X77_04975 [Pseudomonas sp. GW531-E2]